MSDIKETLEQKNEIARQNYARRIQQYTGDDMKELCDHLGINYAG